MSIDWSSVASFMDTAYAYGSCCLLVLDVTLYGVKGMLKNVHVVLRREQADTGSGHVSDRTATINWMKLLIAN